MTRLVLLQCPLDGIGEVHVLVGAPTVEQAAGMMPEMILRLSPDDHQSILNASKS